MSVSCLKEGLNVPVKVSIALGLRSIYDFGENIVSAERVTIMG